jgi:hypothetical protein
VDWTQEVVVRPVSDIGLRRVLRDEAVGFHLDLETTNERERGDSRASSSRPEQVRVV